MKDKNDFLTSNQSARRSTVDAVPVSCNEWLPLTSRPGATEKGKRCLTYF